jgi:hypothetical protein
LLLRKKLDIVRRKLCVELRVVRLERGVWGRSESVAGAAEAGVGVTVLLVIAVAGVGVTAVSVGEDAEGCLGDGVFVVTKRAGLALVATSVWLVVGGISALLT